jgi:ABC-type antimicrobial peptide transport system permease subunit
MESYAAEAMAPTRFALMLIGFFAGTAVILAAVGLYGILAYAVQQRTSEIGVRMAFGAETGRILGLVIRQGMALAVAGIGVGLVGAWGLTRFMEGLLVGVPATDPVTFAGISAVFVAVAALACYLPARRATRVQPVQALGSE